MARKKRHNQYNHPHEVHIRLSRIELGKLDTILDTTIESRSSCIRRLIKSEYEKILEEIAESTRSSRGSHNN